MANIKLKEKIKLKAKIPSSPEQIYNAWLNSKEHSLFTGGKAKISSRLNSKFTAWDNYISGKILDLENNRRILHSWRTEEFPDDSEDSILEIVLKKKGKGTEIILTHTNIPAPQAKNYKSGWKDYYFAPMKEYFKNKKIK